MPSRENAPALGAANALRQKRSSKSPKSPTATAAGAPGVRPTESLSPEKAWGRKEALGEIMDMALFGELDEIEELVERLKRPGASEAVFAGREEPGALHRTPLLAALESGRPRQAEVLLPHSDLSAKTPRGKTVLMLAVALNQVELARKIASHPESQPNARDDSGSSALDFAVGFGRPDNPDMVEALLPFVNAPIEADARDRFRTPLMIAAHSEKPRSLAALLPTSDLFAQSQMESALSFSFGAGNLECARLLLARDHSGAPASYWIRAIEAIVDRGASWALERVLLWVENHLEDNDVRLALSRAMKAAILSSKKEASDCADLLGVFAERHSSIGSEWERQALRLNPELYPRFNALAEGRELSEIVGQAQSGVNCPSARGENVAEAGSPGNAGGGSRRL